jgi:predicted Zn-ribbon and HTH transcriptional regulator
MCRAEQQVRCTHRLSSTKRQIASSGLPLGLVWCEPRTGRDTARTTLVRIAQVYPVGTPVALDGEQPPTKGAGCSVARTGPAARIPAEPHTPPTRLLAREAFGARQTEFDSAGPGFGSRKSAFPLPPAQRRRDDHTCAAHRTPSRRAQEVDDIRQKHPIPLVLQIARRASCPPGSTGLGSPLSQLRCADCGYGVSAQIAPERCPMCSGSVWNHEQWRPFTPPDPPPAGG